MIRYIKTASIIFKSLADFTPSSCATLREPAKKQSHLLEQLSKGCVIIQASQSEEPGLEHLSGF